MVRLQVQQALGQLPPDALSVTGGTLGAISAVQGAGGKCVPGQALTARALLNQYMALSRRACVHAVLRINWARLLYARCVWLCVRPSSIPPSGSCCRAFDVAVRADAGAQQVQVVAKDGIQLTSGLSSAASNAVIVVIHRTKPQVGGPATESPASTNVTSHCPVLPATAAALAGAGLSAGAPAPVQAAGGRHTRGWAQTTITSSAMHAAGNDDAPGFLISFGTRVRQLDPLQLFSLTGTERKDVVYDVANGRISVTAYVDSSNETTPITCARRVCCRRCPPPPPSWACGAQDGAAALSRRQAAVAAAGR